MLFLQGALVLAAIVAIAVADPPLGPALSPVSNVVRAASVVSRIADVVQVVPSKRLKTAATVIGWIGTGLGMCRSVPQMVKNFMNQSADALSMDMFLLSLAGDIVNFTGTVPSKEPKFNLALAVWFIFDTVTFWSQSAYYRYKNPNSANPTISRRILALAVMFFALPIVVLVAGFALHFSRARILHIVAVICLWASNLLFFISRVPQLNEILAKRSFEGVSVIMFIVSFLANVTAGSGILLQDLYDRVPVKTIVFESSGAIFLGTTYQKHP